MGRQAFEIHVDTMSFGGAPIPGERAPRDAPPTPKKSVQPSGFISQRSGPIWTTSKLAMLVDLYLAKTVFVGMLWETKVIQTFIDGPLKMKQR